MITKIKKFVSKVTIVEWVILGIAIAALVVGLNHNASKAKKGPHNGVKAVETGPSEHGHKAK